MVIPCGFKSHSSHQPKADVAELADALDSGSSGFTAVQVQVLSSAPHRVFITKSVVNTLFFLLFCNIYLTESRFCTYFFILAFL